MNVRFFSMVLLSLLLATTAQAESSKSKKMLKSAPVKKMQQETLSRHKLKRSKSFAAGPNNNSAADTSCSGVASCNDMIATCIALGGNVSQTSYDPDSGAPDGAICFSPN